MTANRSPNVCQADRDVIEDLGLGDDYHYVGADEDAHHFAEAVAT